MASQMDEHMTNIYLRTETEFGSEMMVSAAILALRLAASRPHLPCYHFAGVGFELTLQRRGSPPDGASLTGLTAGFAPPGTVAMPMFYASGVESRFANHIEYWLNNQMPVPRELYFRALEHLKAMAERCELQKLVDEVEYFLGHISLTH